MNSSLWRPLVDRGRANAAIRSRGMTAGPRARSRSRSWPAGSARPSR
jgi:hypothetical protein